MKTKAQLHPLCSLFPRMSGHEFDCLKKDIEENGLRTPITIHENMILDGGNRYQACIELGINPIFEDFIGDAIGAFVLSANLHRRHLSPAQAAAIVASVQDWSKSHSHGGDRKSSDARVTCLDTAKNRSNQSGAGIVTQRKADAVAKASPELAGKVARGEISLNDATREVAPQLAPKKKIIEAPDEEQESVDAEFDEQKSIWIESLKAQQDQITDLISRQAVSVMDIPENERIDVLETIAGLRAQVKTLEINLDAVTIARDGYMRENASLMSQCKTQRAQIKKLGGK